MSKLIALMLCGLWVILGAGILRGQTSPIPPGSAPRQLPAKPISSPSLGPAEAPIVVLLFSDFESFFCARSASVLATLLPQGGSIRLIFKHAPASANPNARLAHEAAVAAGAQGKFWEMHDLLFQNQTKLSLPDLLDYAKRVGLDLSTFRQALDSHIYLPVIEGDLAEAKALGVSVAPTLFANGRRLVGPQGYAALGAVLESLMTGIESRQPKKEDIVASGPAQVIDLEHAPTKGLPSAAVSLVEFTDFQCPFCADAAPAVRELLAAYPTQVRFSLKHYPLSMHRDSPLAHEAALAAAEQGKFWEMHDLLFSTQQKLSRDDLIGKARQLNLDLDTFIQDLDSHRLKPRVDADRQEGNRLGVDGTPFFFINGHAISGAVGLDNFKRLIDAALKEVTSPAKAAGAQ